MADAAVRKQQKAVADARNELALRHEAERAAEDEKKERSAQIRARNEAEAVTAMLESLLQSIRQGRDAVADLRKQLDVTAEQLKADRGDPVVPARLLYTLAMTRRRLGDLDPAVELMEIAFKLRVENLGNDHPITRETAREMSYTYVHVGRGDDAIRVLKPVVDVELSALPPDAPESIPLLCTLRIAYSNAGRIKEAEELAGRIVDISRKHYGDDCVNTHWARTNLAWIYRERKQYDLAIPILEKAFACFSVRCAPDSTELLWARGQLGDCFLEIDQPEKAIPYLRDRYDYDLVANGFKHHFTVNSAETLATAYERAGKYAEAMPLRQALADHFREIGNDEAAHYQSTRVAANKAAVN